ncbi:MAG: DUF896 domain-containing protein [Oscillospiraceae bacterium]|nr:DUF896 domain-containing protein [Oscillospiraceae bacterium]
MLDERIMRLNELAKKSKTPEGLTPEETAERDILRREYIEAYKSSLRAQLDATVIQTPDGTRRKLTRRVK